MYGNSYGKLWVYVFLECLISVWYLRTIVHKLIHPLCRSAPFAFSSISSSSPQRTSIYGCLVHLSFMAIFANIRQTYNFYRIRMLCDEREHQHQCLILLFDSWRKRFDGMTLGMCCLAPLERYVSIMNKRVVAIKYIIYIYYIIVGFR